MPLTPTPVVLKFGGSSVGSPDRFRNAVDIVQRYVDNQESVVVVVSALEGVTDRLVRTSQAASMEDRSTLVLWLLTRHRLHAAAVLSLRSQRVFDVVLQEYLADTETLLRSNPDEPLTGSARDALLATGERLVMHIVALALSDAGLRSCATDAADLIRTDDTFGSAAVCLETTFARLRQWYARIEGGRVPVVTGFIGGTRDGATTTLGRGGSDYSASLVATALEARRLERWTDVDGVYTSDPRVDPRAQKLACIVMQDAVSWNHAGRIGIHRKALDPLLEARIPMFVRSIDLPDDLGTAILPRDSERLTNGFKVQSSRVKVTLEMEP